MAQLNVNVSEEVKEAFREGVKDEYGTARKMGSVVEELLVEWLDKRDADERPVTNADLLRAIHDLDEEARAGGETSDCSAATDSQSTSSGDEAGEKSVAISDLSRSILQNYTLEK